MSRIELRPPHFSGVGRRLIALLGLYALAVAPGCDRPFPDDSSNAGRRPFLSAEPNPVPGPGHLAATTIHWDTAGTEGRLVVSVDGGPERLLATGAAGAATADWIAPSTQYHFALYGGREPERPVLARIQVTRARAWPIRPAVLVYGVGILLTTFCLWGYWRINLGRAQVRGPRSEPRGRS